MRLIIREDGSGSELDLFDVEPVVSVHDVCDTDYLPITGYVQGSVYRSLQAQGHMYTLTEWEGIAYAVWLDSSLRRGLYSDHIPDVGESWTAKKDGVPIVWPDWMKASWKTDELAAHIVTGP